MTCGRCHSIPSTSPTCSSASTRDNGAHSFTVAYNTFGERLFFAGRDGAPDAYEQPFDSLDFVYSFFPTDRLSMKFRIQNLLDEELEIKQNDYRARTEVGTTAKIDVKWDLGTS